MGSFCTAPPSPRTPPPFIIFSPTFLFLLFILHPLFSSSAVSYSVGAETCTVSLVSPCGCDDDVSVVRLRHVVSDTPLCATRFAPTFWVARSFWRPLYVTSAVSECFFRAVCGWHSRILPRGRVTRSGLRRRFTRGGRDACLHVTSGAGKPRGPYTLDYLRP